MSGNDREYYRKRAIEERAMAASADKINVAAIHEELARQYEALVEQAELRSELKIFARNRETA